MPDFRVSPLSVVNQIRSNLEERYDSGYPILKELLQNADDAGARRVRVEAFEGWVRASNPLLKGHGLLVINDGVFREIDEQGITSFGESGKATDNTVIGKFGFGQKAVFHMCDAFIVYSYGNGKPFSTVVNPFLEVMVEGNITREWEPVGGSGLAENDLELLRERTLDFKDRCLILWLPFRREDLRPAPGLWFSSTTPSTSETIAELARPDDLAAILTTLRHVESIEIKNNDLTACSVELKESTGRLLGPTVWTNGERRFSGAIDIGRAASVEHFVGREAIAAGGRLQTLQSGAHWPRTISVLSRNPEPQKGEPHAAAVLLRRSKAEPRQLRISWAVFLPVAEKTDIVIPLAGKAVGQFRLHLHGYFFLDSGRQRIEGLDHPASSDEPADGAVLRRTWNATLRDTVLLPLVPRLLRDALDATIVTSAELSDLVLCIVSDDWFKTNRRAICRNDAIARVLQTSGAAIWRLAPSDATLRPLPASVEDMGGKIEELFSEIHAWASDKGALLIVDKRLALTAEPVGWTTDDLEHVLTGLDPRAFQSRDLSRLLGEFLETAEPDAFARARMTPHILSALRKAMIDTPNFAPADSIREILKFVDAQKIFPLPPSVEHREPLRAFASAVSEILPVRPGWRDGSLPPHPVSLTDLKALLAAVQPLLDGAQADQVATAALSLLIRADRSLDELARDHELADLKILRARDVRVNRQIALSLRELLRLSTEASLFAPSPEASKLLPPLADALPDIAVLVVEGDAARYLRETGTSLIQLHPANKESTLRLAAHARRFGPPEARLAFLERIRLEVTDDTIALRRLCAGQWEAGFPDAKLWVVENAFKGLERIVDAIIDQSRNEFLVPVMIADDIKEKLRNHLHISFFETPELQRLLWADPQVVSRLEATAAESDALLETDLTDSLLARLPIYVRTDGTIGDASGVFRETPEWAIPASMEAYVRVVHPASSPRAQARQCRVVRAWTPKSQMETALKLLEPHRYCTEILEGLAAAETEDSIGDLLPALREVRWLFAETAPIAPTDVLALPSNVDEAARATLFTEDKAPLFSTAQNLGIEIRNSDGFEKLRNWVLPTVRQSFDALTMMIKEEAIVGRLGAVASFPVDDFAVLAQLGADLRLPGWRLLASILNSAREFEIEHSEVVSAFSTPDQSQFQIAADHLYSLSKLALDNCRSGEAARRAYFHGFTEVAEWPEEIRRHVFGATFVPTESGGWRSGREVVQSGEGLEPSHVLARNCASLLRGSHEQNEPASGSATTFVNVDSPFGRHPKVEMVDLTHLETKAAHQHRSFLFPWRAHVPPDLVIVYLGLIGRSDPFKDLANEWRADATTDPETLWEELDARFPRQILFPNSLTIEVAQRLISIETVTGDTVRAISMSGEIFDAPLDLAAKGLVVGNLHKKRRMVRSSDGKERDLMTIAVRRVQPSDLEQNRVSLVFREFVETVATDCLYLVRQDQQDALRGILDKATHIDQSTLAETELLLRDRLPTILAELKLPNEAQSQKALRRYQDAEGHHHRLLGPPAEMEELKLHLWREILKPEAAAELLKAVRAKIADFGYSESHIVFELFQNADDAYRQFEATGDEACFRIEILSDESGGFRVVHWGRPINHLGSDVREGRHLGRDRDLLNMLLMNFSEKRGQDLTGKFGLGFKSVHVVSDNVGIASGYIALRIKGGLLPVSWTEGRDAAEAYKRGDGRKATVIDVPFATDTDRKGAEATAAFLRSAFWLPAFAREISRIEIDGVDVSDAIECVRSPILDDQTIDVVVSASTRENHRALRLDLGGGYCLLLKVGATGPEPFSKRLNRLWNLAPLEEEVPSGWLLNGPFDVDPGRGRLRGSPGDHHERIRELGAQFGARLLALHDLAQSEGRRLATALDLDLSDASAETLFWTKLFGVLQSDFDHDLAKHLHGVDRGYGRLAAERHVTPTGLPQPMQSLVRAPEVRFHAEGAISDHTLLGRLQDWAVVANLRGHVVASEIARQLSKIGFKNIQPLRMNDILRSEMGGEAQIDVELATRLGRVLTLRSVEEPPLIQEKGAILEAAKAALFRAQDKTYRPVRSLVSDLGSDDEKLICRFAPDAAQLHRSYRGAAFAFFETARSRSGHSPNASLLAQWARAADNEDRQRAVLKYLIRGDQRQNLAQHVQKERPAWLPSLETLISHRLLSDWSETEKMELLLAIGGYRLFTISTGEAREAKPPPAALVLASIHNWWQQEHVVERNSYARRTYPTSVSLAELREGDDRLQWFTMLALGCFHSLGRVHEEQHRSFIEGGMRQGWWDKLASSKPPGDAQSWVDRLNHWSQPLTVDQPYLQWKRIFVDLYTIARWLDEYVEILRKLPRVIDELGPISLNAAMQPSYWPPGARLCLEAAPINRSLGIGINWIIREMLRFGVYSGADERILGPYCWMSSERLRKLLTAIGANVGTRADKDASRMIHDFVVSHIGESAARFCGDFDLPLQTITRATKVDALRGCFEGSDQDPPDLETDETDLADQMPFEVEP